jgi:hypothetical protein
MHVRLIRLTSGHDARQIQRYLQPTASGSGLHIVQAPQIGGYFQQPSQLMGPYSLDTLEAYNRAFSSEDFGAHTLSLAPVNNSLWGSNGSICTLYTPNG